MRPLARVVAVALALAAAGCGTRQCKGNTILVDITFDAASAGADQLLVSVTVGSATHTQQVAHMKNSVSGSLEIDFAKGYPTGQRVTVLVQAMSGTILGQGVGAVSANGSCATLVVTVSSVGNSHDLATSTAEDLATTMTEMAAPPAADLSSVVGDLSMAPPDFAGCGYVFVSPTGKDGNTGCDPSVPKQTIGGALHVATAHDIIICKGTYNETLDLTATISLHGGYDCSTWKRTASFGYPTFDGVNESKVQSSTSGAAALKIDASGVIVDGLTFIGPLASTMRSTAVNVNAVNNLVTNCKLVGGTTNGAIGDIGSLGLDLEAQGNEASFNLVNGGGGTSSNNNSGSLGVFVNCGCHVHDNTINGGNGANTSVSAGAGAGAVGMWINANADLTTNLNRAIERNTINAGAGAAAVGGAATATTGMLVTNPNATDILSNNIAGGTGSGATIGLAGNSGTLFISRNRIFGGSPSSNYSPTAVELNASGAKVYNNEIQGGTSGSAQASSTGIQAFGSLADIRHNTIVTGRSGFSIGIWVKGLETSIVNNLIYGEGKATALYIDECVNAGSIAQWQANVSGFAYVGYYGPSAGSSCTSGTPFNTVKDLATEIATKCTKSTVGDCSTMNGNQGPLLSADYHLETSCVGVVDSGSGCIALPGCTNPQSGITAMAGTCIGAAFQAYDQASDGVSTLQSTGWLLKSGVPCIISRSMLTPNDLALVPIDWKGTTRTSPYDSIGADEFEGSCQ